MSTCSQNGICYQRSTIRMGQITDGTANTAMLGEKYLQPERYFDGADRCRRSVRLHGPRPRQCRLHGRQPEVYLPLPDEPTRITRHYRFGGPHRAGLNMAFCDGSVN